MPSLNPCSPYLFSFHIFFYPSTGAIFEQGTDDVQSAFKYAMLNHNLNVSSRRFELQAYVDVINTADAFKLSRLSMCFYRAILSFPNAIPHQKKTREREKKTPLHNTWCPINYVNFLLKIGFTLRLHSALKAAI